MERSYIRSRCEKLVFYIGNTQLTLKTKSRTKSRYLSRALINAITSYDEIGWAQCCENAINEIEDFHDCILYEKDDDGKESALNYKTLQRWWREYKQVQTRALSKTNICFEMGK